MTGTKRARAQLNDLLFVSHRCGTATRNTAVAWNNVVGIPSSTVSSLLKPKPETTWAANVTKPPVGMFMHRKNKNSVQLFQSRSASFIWYGLNSCVFDD